MDSQDYEPSAADNQNDAMHKELRTSLQEAERREDEQRSRADGLKSAFTAVLGQGDIVDDISRLHQASKFVEVSQELQTIVIPRVQITTDSLREPTYSGAFDLWMSAQKGTLDLECASSFLQQLVSDPSQTQGAFLPWIHGAVQMAAATFASRIADPPTWTFNMLKEVVIILQVLAYIYNVSPQPWKPSLKEIFDSIADSTTNLPRSAVFSTMHTQVQRLVGKGQYMASWIDLTPSTTVLGSSNSLLASGNHLILDATADALIFVTGNPQTIHLLSHENIEKLDVYFLFSMTLKLRSPVQVLPLQTHESYQIKGPNVNKFVSHPWFKRHRTNMDPVFGDNGLVPYDELP